jgi:hypothetical protein
VPWLRRLLAGLSLRKSGFVPGLLHVEFVVEKVAMDRFIFGFFYFPLSISFHSGFPYSYIIWGMNKRPVGGSSSEM